MYKDAIFINRSESIEVSTVKDAAHTGNHMSKKRPFYLCKGKFFLRK